MRRRPHSYSSARARFPALKKSRSLTVSSREQRFLGARGRTRFQAEAGSAKPAVACPRRVSAARTPTTVPSSAARGRGRPAAAGRARPSSATGASGAERTSSSLYRLLFFTASAAASGGEKLCESSLRDPAATCPLSSLPGNFSPLQLVSGLPRADSGRSPSCQQRPRSGALRLGAAGEGDLPALPKTPAREPQALAPGRGRENGKENKICSPPRLTVPVCLPESANLHSRLAASATLSATLSPYPAGAQHLSATSKPLKIAHDVTPRPSHWLLSLSGGRAHPSPWRPHPRRFFSGPAEAHGMRAGVGSGMDSTTGQK